MASFRVVAREAVSSMRSRVSDAICTAIIPATTNTTSAVTPATCLALMLNDAVSGLRAQGSGLQQGSSLSLSPEP